jgi:hypothetical protein
MAITVGGTTLTFNDGTTQSTADSTAKAWANINSSGSLVNGYNISSTSGTNPCTVNLSISVSNFAPVLAGQGSSGATRYACIGAVNSSSQFTIFNGVALTTITGVAIFG